MESAVLGACVDFGWQGWELVYALTNEGKVGLARAKPLLQDLTTILVDASGVRLGYRQTRPTDGGRIDLPLDKTLHLAFQVEGTQWHGRPLLENVRVVQEKWEKADKGAALYDQRVAGSHFVIYYPPGKSIVNGSEKDNGLVARDLLLALEGSGSITVPTTVAQFVDELSKDSLAWKVEVLEDAGGRQPTFVDRLKYLDALKIRALALPERAVIEGEFGTKAEAGEHGDMAILQAQLIDAKVTQAVNEQVVDSLIALNYGSAWVGSVRLAAAPLVDSRIAFLQQLYSLIITNPAGFAEEFGNVDTDSLKDRLGVPKASQVAQAGEDQEDQGSDEDPDGSEPIVPDGLTEEERVALSRSWTPSLRPPIQY